MLQAFTAQPHAARVAVPRRIVAQATATATVKRADVPLELEEIGLPMNTFGPKNPFTGKIVSVKTITGPKATGAAASGRPQCRWGTGVPAAAQGFLDERVQAAVSVSCKCFFPLRSLGHLE